MAKKQRRDNNSEETVTIRNDEKVVPKLINQFRCICLDNVPGHPYRIGYHKSYIDLADSPRCVYCNGLTADWRKKVADESPNSMHGV